MNPRSSFLGIVLAITIVLPFTLRAQTKKDPLIGLHETALRSVNEKQARSVAELAERYAAYADRMRAQAQEDGDLDRYLALRSEAEHLRQHKSAPEGAPPAEMVQARSLLIQQMGELQRAYQQEIDRIETQYVKALDERIRELTRAGQLDQAELLNGLKKETESRLSPATAVAPAPPLAPEAPALRLGENILRGGTFDDGEAQGWAIYFPDASRNRSEVFSEPNSNRNKALRIHQHASGNIMIERGVNLTAGKTYQVTWRSRLIRPWRKGIEVRGKGHISFGFQLPDEYYNRLPAAERETTRRWVGFESDPPGEMNWQSQRKTITPNPVMDRFVILATPGEGEFLLDDIEIREILTP